LDIHRNFIMYQLRLFHSNASKWIPHAEWHANSTRAEKKKGGHTACSNDRVKVCLWAVILCARAHRVSDRVTTRLHKRCLAWALIPMIERRPRLASQQRLEGTTRVILTCLRARDARVRCQKFCGKRHGAIPTQKQSRQL
jgi:hypothetical protein